MKKTILVTYREGEKKIKTVYLGFSWLLIFILHGVSFQTDGQLLLKYEQQLMSSLYDRQYFWMSLPISFLCEFTRKHFDKLHSYLLELHTHDFCQHNYNNSILHGVNFIATLNWSVYSTDFFSIYHNGLSKRWQVNLNIKS